MVVGSARLQRRAEVRQRVQTAAIELFAQYGYENVTMEDIAAAAEVSLSTVFRHAPSKEGLLTGVTGSVYARLGDSIAARPAKEAPIAALAAAILEWVPADFGAEGAALDAWRRALANAPDAVRRRVLMNSSDQAALVAAMAARMKTDPEHDIGPATLVAVAVAATDVAFGHWVRTGTDVPLRELCRQALALAASGVQ